MNVSLLVALIKLVKEIEDWKMLGVYLGMNAVLMDIKSKNHYQSGSGSKGMIMTWLDKEEATSAKFIEALNVCVIFALFKKLSQKY